MPTPRKHMDVDKRFNDEEDPLIDLFTSSKFSDCTIKCKDEEWRLHKAILASRCGFFAAAFEGGFMEAESNVIELHDENVEGLGVMLSTLYVKVRADDFHGEIIDMSDWSALDGIRLTTDIITTADKYRQSSLAQMAVTGLEEQLEHGNASSGWIVNEREKIALKLVQSVFAKDACAWLEDFKETVKDFVVATYTHWKGSRERVNEILGECSELRMMMRMDEFARGESSSEDEDSD